MPIKRYDIDIYQLLRSTQCETFTVGDVTKYVLRDYPDVFDKTKNAIQFVYRNLKRYEKEGKIHARPGDSGKAIVFQWPDDYQEIAVEASQPDSHKLNDISCNSIISTLQEKIRLCKAEMLTSIGETEAYSEWVEEMPELANDVKSRYQNSREQAKLMLGKVKGFEQLLAEYQERLS